MNTPQIDIPEIGWFRLRLVCGGPWVAARIYWSVAKDPVTGEQLDRSPVMLGEIMGKPISPIELWPRVAGHRITEQEYQYLMHVKAWADAHDPTAPEATPDKRIDLNRMKPIF